MRSTTVEPLRLDDVIAHVPDAPTAAVRCHNHIGLTAVLVTETIAVLHTRDHGPGRCLTHDPDATGGRAVCFADTHSLASQFAAVP